MLLRTAILRNVTGANGTVVPMLIVACMTWEFPWRWVQMRLSKSLIHYVFSMPLRRDATIQRPAWLPDQALPLTDALWGYTLGAAYAGAEEQRKGSLSVGKLGDAVVLREDILSVPQEKMSENGVQATIIGGNVVYGYL